jgi:flagellar biosynthetic protein FliR
VLAGILWQLSLGLLARLVPQLQVYFAALPGQILGGIAMLGLLLGAMIAVWQQAVQAGLLALPGH